MPDLVGIFRKLDPFNFPLAVLVEQAKLNLRGIGGEDRKVDAQSIPCGSEGVGKSFPDTGGATHVRGYDLSRRLLTDIDFVIH
jgi:hypothetical protein